MSIITIEIGRHVEYILMSHNSGQYWSPEIADNPTRTRIDTTHPKGSDSLGNCETRILALKEGNMTLGYHIFVVPQYQKREWNLQAIKSHVMT